ncbi:MAG TPA: tetraacyldisaccharide 4'-kinase [Candidatus Margulisiibacteriota bacterium]|nr:tetraacyldisaccharide 4'-kinase [Candidatus Margulisiibacteriota bacterium]
MLRDYLYSLATDKRKGILSLLPKAFLYLLSLLYFFLVSSLALFNRLASRRFPCRVISVGNITLGGTGKTPLVELIVRYLKSEGHKVAVLTRGYKKKSDTMGDEAYMLSRKLDGTPVIVDANRRRGIRRAIKEYAVDTVVLDDGFQQWGIKKDLEIVTVDAVNPFGNGQLIPRGILREPLSSLKRADIIVLTKVDLASGLTQTKDIARKMSPKALVLESTHLPLGFMPLDGLTPLAGLEEFTGRQAALFCGIGDPESFRILISSLKIRVELFFKFSDHHHYSAEDLRKIADSCREHDIKTVLTTEKDAARLQALASLIEGGWFLKIALKLKDEERLRDRLSKLYIL